MGDMDILVINCFLSTELCFFFFPRLVKIPISIHCPRNFLGGDIHFIMKIKCPSGLHHQNGTARMPTLPFSSQIFFFFFLIHTFMITDHTLDLGDLWHSLYYIKIPAGKRWHPRFSNLRRILRRCNSQI